MPKAIFVTQFEPRSTGHGGNHRAYQIAHDLGQLLGAGNVTVVSWPGWQRSLEQGRGLSDHSAHRPAWWPMARRIGRGFILPWLALRAYRECRRLLRQTLRKLRERLPFLWADHPIDVLAQTGRGMGRYREPGFAKYYERSINGLDGQAICIIEHADFVDLIPVNRRHGIQTVACVQNLESFDTAAPLDLAQRRRTYLTGVEFAHEFRALARCDARLAISKVEAGVLGGLGLPCDYYPYRPVGQIREDLTTIRDARESKEPIPGLFLMLGTGAHRTTWASFSWFVQNASRCGLPENVRVVIAGLRTDQLLPSGTAVPGLELKGWVEQDELDELLARVQAVLVPQMTGFGALTRLSELSCAGIPVIVSRHPTYALDLPPGITVVNDTWHAWRSQLGRAPQRAVSCEWREYQAWEAKQPSALARTVEGMLRMHRRTGLDAVETAVSSSCARER